MVTLDWDLDRTEGVTLVRAYVTAERPRRVRVENRLDGPVWPPRRRGRPAPEWDDGGFEGVVTPDDRLVAGYATPARPDDPPVAIASDEPAAETEAGGDGGPSSPDRASTPAGVVRSLGDPVVPRDAVPVPDADASADDAPDETTAATGPSRNGSDESRPPVSADENGLSPNADDSPPSETGGLPPERSPAGDRRDAGAADAAALVVPGAVRDWIRDLDRRLTAAERRRSGSGPDPALATAVAADRRALDRVERRLGDLRARADDLDCGRSDRAQTAGER